jgi:hypothetical protein
VSIDPWPSGLASAPEATFGPQIRQVRRPFPLEEKSRSAVILLANPDEEVDCSGNARAAVAADLRVVSAPLHLWWGRTSRPAAVAGNPERSTRKA